MQHLICCFAVAGSNDSKRSFFQKVVPSCTTTDAFLVGIVETLSGMNANRIVRGSKSDALPQNALKGVNVVGAGESRTETSLLPVEQALEAFFCLL